jgi:hypothetical protein
MPDLTQKLHNIFVDSANAINIKFDKLGITDIDLSNDRMSICGSCEQYNAAIKQCKSCGCYLPVKTRLISAKCPLSHW